MKLLKKIMKAAKKATGAASAKKAAPKKAAKLVKKTAPKKTTHPTKKKPVPKKSIKIPKTAKKTAHSSKKAAPKGKHPTSKQKTPANAAKPSKPKKAQLLEFAQTLAPQVERASIRSYPVLPGGENERLKLLLPLLKELVRKGEISDWLVNLRHSRGANIYVERGNVEDELTSIRDDLTVTVYKRYDDGMMGEAQAPIIGQDAPAIKQELHAILPLCAFAKRAAFPLPEPAELTFPESHDERMRSDTWSGNGLSIPRQIVGQTNEIMRTITDVHMNALEVLSNAGTIRIMNSNGIDVSFHKTTLYLEAVMTCTGKEGEREFLTHKLVVSPEQLDLQGLLIGQAQIARDATIAAKNPGFTGDVMIAGASVTEFFAPHHDLNPLVLHTSAKIAHMGLARLKLHQSLGHIVGEPITITTNPHLPLGLGTMPVDEEGAPMKTTELIRSGVFVQHIATPRYAYYLQVPMTGNLGNVQVNPGATREQHLRGNNYLEIVSFSWFNPNPFSGDFSAEIRLAYHWVNGRRSALRGGTFTGNVFTNLLNARFSKEIMQSGSYYGPRAVLFKQAVVNKFE
jgi:predicted Zn-dependent protease